MIKEFSVKNFFSYKDKVTFSMEASSDKNLLENVIEFDNLKLLRTAAIYGANASGKSNLFKILGTVVNSIKNSNLIQEGALLPFVPYKFSEETINEPCEFEITFIAQGIKYEYSFKATNKAVIEEELLYYPKKKKSKIFTRKNISEYEFVNDKGIMTRIAQMNSANKFFIATATAWNLDITKIPFDYLANNIEVLIANDINSNPLRGYAFNSYCSNVSGKLKEFALNLLKEADFEISNYSVSKEMMDKASIKDLPPEVKQLLPDAIPSFKAFTIHTLNNKDYKLDIIEESLGTQAIFDYIPVFYDILENGKTVFIDEMDKSLHTLITKMIIKLFNNEEFNKNNSQLIFNSHDTNLLDLELLRRDQIWFVDKNIEDRSSDLYSLLDFKARSKEVIEYKYLLGRYGGIPRVNTL